MDDLGENNPANAAAIVTGDFNEVPSHVAIRDTMGALFDDAWVKVHGPSGGLTGCLQQGQATCRLDYIFVARNSGITATAVVVDEDATLSDHFPVFARFD
jgi:endonuclease/exonuclease/phosphatase family metal-dependent hydrolase